MNAVTQLPGGNYAITKIVTPKHLGFDSKVGDYIIYNDKLWELLSKDYESVELRNPVDYTTKWIDFY